eukprot:COSAG04_NODE_25209_length_310_cov_1.312796_1_plen_33_part_01
MCKKTHTVFLKELVCACEARSVATAPEQSTERR